MKRFITSCVSWLMVFFIHAEDYKIISMNTTSVHIDNRECKVGDVFSDKSVIHWSHDLQAVKAANIRTKEIHVFSKIDFKKESAKTVDEYYVKKNRLSSLALSDIKDISQQTENYVLYDTIYIHIPIMVDNTSNYYVSFIENGSYKKKLVTFKNGGLIVDRSLFGNSSGGREMYISLLYNTGSSNSYYMLNDSIKIVILPSKIIEY